MDDDDIVECVRDYLGISERPGSLIDFAERMKFKREARQAEYLAQRKRESENWIDRDAQSWAELG